ncbi:IS1595 family transposase [Chloroflexota bacterium]
MERYTAKDFDNEFSTDDACLEWIKDHRWPDGIHCVKCNKVTKHHRIKNRNCYSCDNCGTQVYPTAGTIFHKSPTPLTVWFVAIYRMASTSCGISAKQIQREMGVTYKTAWRMFHQIRSFLGEDIIALDGDVQVDETIINEKKKGTRGKGAEGKAKVVGAAKHNGKVIAQVVPDAKRHTIVPFIAKKISREATLYADEFPTYDTMVRFGYTKKRICNGYQARAYKATGDYLESKPYCIYEPIVRHQALLT